MDQKMPLYKQEFPDFGHLDVVLPSTFEDYSWHNDVCPSFAEEQADGSLLRIWVDYADPGMRENKGSPRFNLSHYTKDDEWVSDVATDDDIANILQAVESFKALKKPGMRP